MKDLDEFRVCFINWKKYQKETRYKTHWFAFEADFFHNKNFVNFTHSERLFFIYLLCQTLTSGEGGSYVIRTSFDCRMSMIKKSQMISCIKKLIHCEIVMLHNITRHNKEIPLPPLVDNLVDNFEKSDGKFINEPSLEEEFLEHKKRMAQAIVKGTLR